jgi:16S rRNA A1518/A1519 N6-dimethyltransferase RsmA/KsgA/DIM1 with predicted DNA glycosylase/AP lyase activity
VTVLDHTKAAENTDFAYLYAPGHGALEQHMLDNTRGYLELLRDCHIENSQVLELGCGTGVLTQLILDMRPAKVVGYEIHAGLCKVVHPTFELREIDLFTADLGFLSQGNWKIISNPPYNALPLLREIIDRYAIQDAVIMTSRKKSALFPDFEVALILDGADFSPPSTGEHLVLRKGFR